MAAWNWGRTVSPYFEVYRPTVNETGVQEPHNVPALATTVADNVVAVMV